jgi:hypothetical protein
MPPSLFDDLFDQLDRRREEGRDLIEQSRRNRAASAAARKMRGGKPEAPRARLDQRHDVKPSAAEPAVSVATTTY